MIAIASASIHARPEGAYAGKKGSLVISMLRGFFTALRIAPGLGGFLAYRMFFLPRFGIKSKRKSKILETGMETIRLSLAGKEALAYKWGTGPRILLAHGWESSAFRFEALIEAIVRQGYSAVAFDAPGHGYSSGTITDILEISALMGELDRGYGPFHSVVGHSFGGVCALYAATKGLRTSSLILFSTPASFEGIFRKFCGSLRIRGRLRAKFRAKVEAHFRGRENDIWQRFSADKNMARLEIPSLIIQDREDTVVPFEEALDLREAGHKSDLLLTEGFGHSGILRSPAAMEKCFAFWSEIHARKNAGLIGSKLA
jgi:pimeloyl-ACP methyl ester carboxylesterase